jgi:hypothetical protein
MFDLIVYSLVMYVNLIPFQDQAKDLLDSIDGIESPSDRLSAILRIESDLIKGFIDLRKKTAYDLVRASEATDAAIEVEIDPRKLHRWANEWAKEKNLPRKRLKIHRFDPQEAVHLQALNHRPAEEAPIHPIASPQPPVDPVSD